MCIRDSHDTELVGDSLWYIEPVQLGVKKLWQASVKLLCAAERERERLCLDPAQSNSVLSLLSLSRFADIQQPTCNLCIRLANYNSYLSVTQVSSFVLYSSAYYTRIFMVASYMLVLLFLYLCYHPLVKALCFRLNIFLSLLASRKFVNVIFYKLLGRTWPRL